MPELKEPKFNTSLDCFVEAVRGHTSVRVPAARHQGHIDERSSMEFDITHCPNEDVRRKIKKTVTFNGYCNIRHGDSIKAYFDRTNWGSEGNLGHSAVGNVRMHGELPEKLAAYKIERVEQGRVVETYTNGMHT